MTRLVGREIVEEEQRGRSKAAYGQALLADLSAKLQKEFAVGYSLTNLKHFRQFFLTYPRLLRPSIGHALRDQLLPPSPRGKAHGDVVGIGHAARDQSGEPGTLNPNLSWTLYRHLVRVEDDRARTFYEIEAVDNRWTERELDRQINSLLFERLAKSRDKAGLMRLARKGHEVQSAVGDQPSPGLILCTDKNDAVVRYTLGADQQRKIFASRYKLHVPTEAELKAEIRRELHGLVRPATKRRATVPRRKPR